MAPPAPPSIESNLLLSHLPSNLAPCSAPHPAPLPSYWSHHFVSPLADHNRSSALPERVDVVVVGSGLTGTFAVSRLVDRVLDAETGNEAGSSQSPDSSNRRSSPLSIVVLEARQFCSGATGRNGGHLTELPTIAFEELCTSPAGVGSVDEALRQVEHERRSIQMILGICEEHGWEDEVDLVRGGNVHLFDTEEEMGRAKASVERAKQEGVDVGGFEFISAKEAQKQYGASGLVGALRMPGNNLYPAKFVSKLFQHSLDRINARGTDDSAVSLELFTHCIVESVAASGSEKDRWEVKTKGRGLIRADYVLHCTNGYASHLVPSLARGSLRIVPTRGQVLSIRPDAHSNPKLTHSFASPRGGEQYFFQRPGPGSIILGGSRSASPRTDYEFGSTDDASVNPTISDSLKAFLPKQFPEVFHRGKKGIEGVEQEWTGIMAYTATSFPLVGPLYSVRKDEVIPLEGQYISAGYSGHGMPRAPGCGIYLAELVLRDLGFSEKGSEKGWEEIMPLSWRLIKERWEEQREELARIKKEEGASRCVVQ